MKIKSHAKFDKKLTCGLENDMGNLAQIWLKTVLSWDPFVQSRKYNS